MSAIKIFDIPRLLLLAILAGGMSGCATVTTQDDVLMPARKGVVPKTLLIQTFEGGVDSQGDEIKSLISGGLTREAQIPIVTQNPHSVLTGQLTFSSDTESWTKEKVKQSKSEQLCESGNSGCSSTTEEIKYLVYYYQRTRQLTVNYSLNIDGRLIGGSHSAQDKGTWTSSESAINAKVQAGPENANDATLMQTVANEIVKDISPYHDTVDFNFKKGTSKAKMGGIGSMVGDPNLKLAIKYVQNKRYDQAVSIFQQVADNAILIENRAAANYNIGLILEMKGEYKKAFEYYSNANQMNPSDTTYIKALTQAEERYQMKKAVDLQQQMIEGQ